MSQSGGGKTPLEDFLSCIFFANAVNPQWWNVFFGGSGYMGVLVLMWLLYPLYLKKIDNLSKSTIGLLLVYLFVPLMYSFACMNCLIEDHGTWNAWLTYILRAVYSFSLGNVLFYLKGISLKFSRLCTWLCSILLLGYIGYKFLYLSIDNFLFVLIWVFIIWLNMEKSVWIIDNMFWAFLGKHIFEIFVSHILSYYILVKYFGIMNSGSKIVVFSAMAILTLIIAVLFKCMFEKASVLFQKFRKKSA